MVITISHKGYIKRLPISTYRRQNRGGKGVTGAGTREEDFIEHIFITSTHHYILFFTDKGKIYWEKVYQIPQAGRTSRGKAIVNLLSLKTDEKITAFVWVKEFDSEHHLIMATEQGIIKKTNLEAYSHPRETGIIALSLDENDKLIEVKLTDGNDGIILATLKGKAIRFSEKQIRPTGRTARGVKGITLAKDDKVIGMEIVKDKASILTISEHGYGKKTLFSEYRQQSRGGKGIINIKTTSRNGNVIGLKTVVENDEIIIMSSGGMITRIPMSSIRTISRNTQGVRLIKLNENDKVIDLAKIETKEESQDETEIETEK
jgi:DNA gyrase subunit A